MEEQQTQQAEVNKQVQGATTFGIASLTQPTPMWVTWAFRIQFVLNKAVLMIFSTTDFMTGDTLKNWVAILAVIDFTVWGLGRFVGIKKEDFETGS